MHMAYPLLGIPRKVEAQISLYHSTQGRGVALISLYHIGGGGGLGEAKIISRDIRTGPKSQLGGCDWCQASLARQNHQWWWGGGGLGAAG